MGDNIYLGDRDGVRTPMHSADGRRAGRHRVRQQPVPLPQPVELDLRRWEGMVPVELLGGVPFPSIGELPYLLTLGSYGFYWFRLTPDHGGQA